MTNLYLGNVDNVCGLFYELYEEGRQSNRSVDQFILIRDSLEVLESATMMLELNVRKKHTEWISEMESRLMMSILIIIKFIIELDTTVYQICRFRDIVYRLVRLSV